MVEIRCHVVTEDKSIIISKADLQRSVWHFLCLNQASELTQMTLLKQPAYYYTIQICNLLRRGKFGHLQDLVCVLDV